MIIEVEKLKIRKGVLPKKNKKKETPLQISERFVENVQDNMRVLRLAQKYWEDLADWRKRNYRNFQYYRGRQWYETVVVEGRDGKEIRMTEEDYIKSQGKIPFKQNIIRQLIKNILGQYRSNPTDSIVISRSKDDQSKSEMLTNALQAALEMNQHIAKDARELENLCINAAAICKTSFKYFPTKNREDIKLSSVDANRIIFNGGLRDVEDDLRMIGDIIDAPINDIISAFAKSVEEAEAIKKLYNVTELNPGTGTSLTAESVAVTDFMIPADISLCRLYEIWEYKMEKRLYVHDYYDGTKQVVKAEKEDIDAINAKRIDYYASQGIAEEDVPLMKATEKMEQFWYVKYLTPNGACLYEGETPYQHESHPYTMELYPLVNGEVWSLIEDIIDQQRYINRLIAMLDFIMGASAKGVLLVPEESIPADMDINDIAESWTKYNGVIKYKAKPGVAPPTQVSSNSTNIGATEMLTLQMQLIMQISGVNQSIQGQKANSGTPSSLYAQESQNSMMNTKDMLDVFAEYKRKRDYKVVSLIRQYYDDRIISISGTTYNKEAAQYKASEAKAIKDIDVTVVAGTDTPVFRSIMDDTLWKLLEAGLIDIEMFLNNTSMPFKDRLLSDIQTRKQAVQEQNMEGIAANPQQMQQMAAIQQQAASQSDPRAIEMIKRMAAN